jgi:hypothetical protein
VEITTPLPGRTGDAGAPAEALARLVSLLSLQHYQAARFTDAATAGTIASRHCPLDQVTLAPVPAIEPYLADYTAFMRRMARRVRTAPSR